MAQVIARLVPDERLMGLFFSHNLSPNFSTDECKLKVFMPPCGDRDVSKKIISLIQMHHVIHAGTFEPRGIVVIF
jgi:hypothetical protein